jgi:hypothetical protein
VGHAHPLQGGSVVNDERAAPAEVMRNDAIDSRKADEQQKRINHYPH